MYQQFCDALGFSEQADELEMGEEVIIT